MSEQGPPGTLGDVELPREVWDEIRHIAHFGRAHAVKENVAAAMDALEDGRPDDALAPLEEAKRHAPRSPSVRSLLGLAHYRRGSWRDASREFAAYRRLSGRGDQDPLYADTLRALGRPEKAVELLESLSEQAVPVEAFIEALIVRAGALRDLGRAQDAVAVLRTGPLHPREILSHHLRLWYALAEALEEAGQRKEAREWWDAVYAEDPDFFDVSRRRLGLRR